MDDPDRDALFFRGKSCKICLASDDGEGAPVNVRAVTDIIAMARHPAVPRTCCLTCSTVRPWASGASDAVPPRMRSKCPPRATSVIGAACGWAHPFLHPETWTMIPEPDMTEISAAKRTASSLTGIEPWGHVGAPG